MTGCKRTCLHRSDVRAYQSAREAAEVQREAETAGYAAEIEQYGKIVDYKAWLEAKAGSREEEHDGWELGVRSG